MKKLLFITIGFIMCLNLAAQDDEEIQTLFGQGTKITGFGGPFMNFTIINGEFGHMMGGGGGIIMNGFFFGGYGEGLTNYIVDDAGFEIEFGHGGFWAGYSFLGKKPIHPSISTQIGWGGISLKDADGYDIYYNDNVFVLNPTIELEMNFTQFFRLSIGANYRLVAGVDASGLSSQAMSGPGVFLGFKFGWF
ncbi:MAG: hypothetical protein ISS19_07975 [Bacteroidales bacterium]|nr:hypothetical protein [Bacteroidales bacterium]